MPIISQFLRDANTFVASSHVAISRSAPHIYLSALPFAAKDSLVYRDCAPFCVGVISATTIGIERHGGRLVATLTGHGNEVKSVAYSPDGRLLASGSDDGTVRIWDTRTGEEAMIPLRGNDGMVLSVAFARDGKRIVSGGGKVVHVWSVETGHPALPPLRGHSSWVLSVAFSLDGTLVASASADKTVRLWNAESGLEVAVMNGHTEWVCAVAFSPNGQLLASASGDGTIRLWNFHTGKEVGDSLARLDNVVRCLGFSPDSKYLAAGYENTYEIRIWDIDSREKAPVVINNQSGVMSLAFSPDGLRLLSAGLHRIRSWNPQTGREIPGSSLTGHSDWVYSVAVSPDGLFLASGSTDRTNTDLGRGEWSRRGCSATAGAQWLDDLGGRISRWKLHRL